MTIPIGVRNPRTGKVDYWITPPTPDDLAELCHRLRKAQVDWQQGGLEARIEALQQWKQAVQANRDELIQALVADTGRLAVSVLEVDSFLGSLDRWCRLAPDLLQGEQRNTAIPFIRIQQTAVPYPLVGVISPWNFPLLLSTIDTIPTKITHHEIRTAFSSRGSPYATASLEIPMNG
jgi:succinate-semialdehyde dehydrogenase/glutarate-semialdehyde dehydrogenase